MAVRIAYFKSTSSAYYYASYFTIRASDFDLITMIKDKESIKEYSQRYVFKIHGPR